MSSPGPQKGREELDHLAERIIAIRTADPEVSIGALASRTGISRSFVTRVLVDAGLHETKHRGES